MCVYNVGRYLLFTDLGLWYCFIIKSAVWSVNKVVCGTFRFFQRKCGNYLLIYFQFNFKKFGFDYFITCKYLATTLTLIKKTTLIGYFECPNGTAVLCNDKQIGI